jgi:transposase
MAPQKQDLSTALSADTQNALNEYPVLLEPTFGALALSAANSEPERVSGAYSLIVGAVEGLSFTEVIARYEIGASTLRKWLAAGKLTGAARVATSKGLAYRIPEAALVERGVLLKGNASSSVELAQAKAQAETLEARLKEVEGLLGVERTRADTEKTRADSEAKQRLLLEEGQVDLRRALLMLEAATKKKPRWWNK